MKEIDQKLKQWIKNSTIRAEVKEVIIKEMKSVIDRAYKRGLEAGLDHKINTNH